MRWLWSFCQSVGRSWLVVFEDDAFRGEAGGIICSRSPLLRLAASHRGREEDPASREEAPESRTQSTQSFSGTRGRRKSSQKLTTAHSGYRALRIAEDEPLAVCYRPTAFEDLRELEGVA